MCMVNPNQDNLDKLDSIAYKVVVKKRDNNFKYYTPWREAEFNDTLEAEGDPNIFYSDIFYRMTLHGGAIHCYRELNKALTVSSHFDDTVVLKVKGINPIAYNKREIAFKKIKVIEEIIKI